MYEDAPKRIVFGETVWCPTCHGKKHRPGDKTQACMRCGGNGIIPNKGPVAAPKKP
jgi:DnaJ-class molecular chaperone